MDLVALYQLMDQGKLDEAFLAIESLHDEARLEGELWKAYFLLEVYGDLGQAHTIVEQVFAKCQASSSLQSLVGLLSAFVFMWKGKYKESQTELDQVQKFFATLSADDRFTVRHYQAFLWLVQGLCSLYQANYNRALDNFSQGLQIATEEPFTLKWLAPTIYYYMGYIYTRIEDENRTEDYYNKSLTTFKSLGNDLMQAAPLAVIGLCYWHQGDINRGLESSQIALDLAQKANHQTAIQCALWSLGSINRARGELKQAKKYLQRALTLSEELGNPYYVANSLWSLGRVYWEFRDLKKVKDSYQRSLTIYEELGNPYGISNCLNGLAHLNFFLGDLNKTKEYLERGIALTGETSRWGTNSLNNLGELYRLRGEMDKAETVYKRALTNYEKQGFKRGIATVQGNLGYVYWHQGELLLAEEACRQTINLKEEIEDVVELAEAREFLVRILLAQERLAEAITEIDQLDILVQTKKVPIFDVWHQLARSRLYLKQFDLTLALRAAEEAKTRATALGAFSLLVEAMKLSIRGQLQLYMLSKKDPHKIQLETELQELHQLSKREHLHSAFIETLVVQGMLKRVEFDLPSAIQQFEEAERLATEQGLLALAQKARIEIQQIHEQGDFLQRLMVQAPEAYKHMQMETLAAYLEKARVQLEKAS